jgi:gluconate 2-dehydrogenase gamma chain
MDASVTTRRDFMASATGILGSGWLWLNLPVIATLSACARDAARTGAPFTFFTAAQGRAMQAFAARIIPAHGGLPGAEQAGAAWFADGALAGPFADGREPVLAGLADLDERAQAAHGAAFAELSPARQDGIIGDIEETQFFEVGRMLVVMGTLCDPSWGGNRDHAGFTLLGMAHAPVYSPPFGWYDAEHARTNGGAA